jgi:hypothetical protein
MAIWAQASKPVLSTSRRGGIEPFAQAEFLLHHRVHDRLGKCQLGVPEGRVLHGRHGEGIGAEHQRLPTGREHLAGDILARHLARRHELPFSQSPMIM